LAVGGPLRNISINDKGHMWGTDPDCGIWFKNGLKSDWSNLSGCAWSISVNNSGDVYYSYWWKGSVYKAETPNGWTYQVHTNNPWWHQYGYLMRVAAGDNGRVWGINKENKVERNSDSWHNRWTSVPTAGIKMESISAGKGDRVWGASTGGEVYYMDGNDGKWVQDKAAMCSQISATEDGRVCCTSPENTVLVSDKVGEWLQVRGWNNVMWVGCANKGNICATNDKHVVYCRDTEKDKVIAARKAVEDAKAAQIAKEAEELKAEQRRIAAENARIAAEKEAEK